MSGEEKKRKESLSRLGYMMLYQVLYRRNNSLKDWGMDDPEMLEFEARVSQRVREETMEEMNMKLDALVQQKCMSLAKKFSIQIPNQIREDILGRSPFTSILDPSSCYSRAIVHL